MKTHVTKHAGFTIHGIQGDYHIDLGIVNGRKVQKRFAKLTDAKKFCEQARNYAGFTTREWRAGFQVDLGKQNGKRIQRQFRFLDEAQTYADHKRTELTNKGLDALNLSDRDRLNAMESKKKLGNVSIIEAVDFYLKYHHPAGGTKTVQELIPEYLAAPGKKKSKRRPATLNALKWRLNAFARHYGNRNVHEITRNDIEHWLDTNGWQGLNMRHYVAVLHEFFWYAKKQGLITLNPTVEIDKPEVEQKPPEIMTPKSISKVLNTAMDKDSCLVPRLAISFFAGLRPNEVNGLDWKDVDLSEKIIRVVPAVAKMRRQRLIDISDNLVSWLMPFKKDSGKVWPYGSTTYWHKLKELLNATGVTFPYNAGRHAFASYHYAQHRDANETSLQLGHTNSNMLVTTYRGLVTRKAGTDFWAIRPKQKGKIIKLPAAG